jgi:hypothetical protein
MSKRATWCDRRLVMSPVYFGICTSAAQFAAECRKLGLKQRPEWIPAAAAAVCHILANAKGETACIVAVPPRKRGQSRAEYAALIVHEAVHVWQQVREALGEEKPSSEFEAYSLQAICQELFEAVNL